MNLKRATAVIKLRNTLTNRLEKFTPINEGKVSMFVCGPTVYDYSHIGHAKTYVQFDTLARVLKASGLEVNYIQNITDIDDKIIARASKKGQDWNDVRNEFETKFLEDMEALNITSVDNYARATDHIDDIIQQVQTMLEKGIAYKIKDGVYFEIAKFSDYGKLSGRTEIKENDSQSRIDQSADKKGWNDFCLWKFSKPGEPVWNAPFGKGRPGWHIEDTAITEHFFGSQYDIHGGAVDLIFPHHEAEIAQMEASSGKKPFVRYWLHAGFLTVNNTKMSKSLGNFLTIQDVIKSSDPLAVRLMMLQSHYRSSINFTDEILVAATNRLKSLQAFADLRFQTNQKAVALNLNKRSILAALQNDLDTPSALAELSSVVDLISNNLLSENDVDEFKNYLEFLDTVFGLDLSIRNDISDEQKTFLKARDDARNSQNWEMSDRIRDELLQQGIRVLDHKLGQVWSRT
jgi:cysteinyl-tRNA synthetase